MSGGRKRLRDSLSILMQNQSARHLSLSPSLEKIIAKARSKSYWPRMNSSFSPFSHSAALNWKLTRPAIDSHLHAANSSLFISLNTIEMRDVCNFDTKEGSRNKTYLSLPLSRYHLEFKFTPAIIRAAFQWNWQGGCKIELLLNRISFMEI